MSCRTVHPTLGPCVAGAHDASDPAQPHAYGPTSPTADGPCPDCGRPVRAASERNGAACGCDHADPCELHAAEPARPYYHRACSRRTLRRRLERIAAR